MWEWSSSWAKCFGIEIDQEVLNGKIIEYERLRGLRVGKIKNQSI